MHKNCVLVVIFGFLIVFVQPKYFNYNFYKEVFETDQQCRYIKEFAYDGLLYKTRYFSLSYFFTELSKNNCTSSIEYECKKNNFLYTDFNSVLYAYFCDKKSFFEKCSQSLTKLTKKTNKYLLNLNDQELSNELLKHIPIVNSNLESCLSVPILRSNDLLKLKNFSYTEVKNFGLFNTTWTMLPGFSTDLEEREVVKR